MVATLIDIDLSLAFQVFIAIFRFFAFIGVMDTQLVAKHHHSVCVCVKERGRGEREK